MTPRAVGDWVREVAGDALARRTARLAEIESMPLASLAPVEAEANEVSEVTLAPTGDETVRDRPLRGHPLGDHANRDHATPASVSVPVELPAAVAAAIATERASAKKRVWLVAAVAFVVVGGALGITLSRREAVAAVAAAPPSAPAEASALSKPVVDPAARPPAAPSAAPASSLASAPSATPPPSTGASAPKPVHRVAQHAAKPASPTQKRAPRAEDLFSRN
jgi:hypothetical protein